MTTSELAVALVAGMVGIFFTHRVFVKFVLSAIAANHAIARGERYVVTLPALVGHAFEIALGLVPLGYGVVRFVQWAWTI